MNNLKTIIENVLRASFQNIEQNLKTDCSIEAGDSLGEASDHTSRDGTISYPENIPVQPCLQEQRRKTPQY